MLDLKYISTRELSSPDNIGLPTVSATQKSLFYAFTVLLPYLSAKLKDSLYSTSRISGNVKVYIQIPVLVVCTNSILSANFTLDLLPYIQSKP